MRLNIMNYKNQFAVGVDLGGTNIKIGIVSDSGKILEKSSIPTQAERGPKKVLDNICEGVSNLISSSKVKIAGIGIGCPGIVLPEEGVVKNPPNLPGWKTVLVSQIIFEKLHIKTIVENDANVAAVGELIFGAGKKLNDFIMVTLGTGVGGGIVINKKVYHGMHGAAGEIGHITINYKGRKCNCGSIGCIETYAGNQYLKARVIEELQFHPDSLIVGLVENNFEKISPLIIQKAASIGDKYSKSVIQNLGMHLGAAFASIGNAFDITNFIVGGGVAGFGKPLLDSIAHTASSRVMTPLRNKIKIIPAKLRNDAGIKGASALIFNKY